MACTVLPQGLSSWDADADVAILSPVRTIGVLGNPPPVTSSNLIIGCIADNNHRVIDIWPAVVVFGTYATLLSEDTAGIKFEAGWGANSYTNGLILN